MAGPRRPPLLPSKCPGPLGLAVPEGSRRDATSAAAGRQSLQESRSEGPTAFLEMTMADGIKGAGLPNANPYASVPVPAGPPNAVDPSQLAGAQGQDAAAAGQPNMDAVLQALSGGQ